MSDSGKKQTNSKDLQKQLDEMSAKWKRALADYQNLEKRIEAHQAQFVRLANATLLQNLIEVIDDLERAAGHIKDSGLDIVVSQLHKTLEKEGVRRIKTVGEEFDPNLMECAETVEGKQNEVVREHKAGYMLHDTVLRPAQVEVGNGQSGK